MARRNLRETVHVGGIPPAVGTRPPPLAVVVTEGTPPLVALEPRPESVSPTEIQRTPQ